MKLELDVNLVSGADIYPFDQSGDAQVLGTDDLCLCPPRFVDQSGIWYLLILNLLRWQLCKEIRNAILAFVANVITNRAR